jgi:hypothetical protein
VLESGECVSSQLIPGITVPGTWEWKEVTLRVRVRVRVTRFQARGSGRG